MAQTLLIGASGNRLVDCLESRLGHRLPFSRTQSVQAGDTLVYFPQMDLRKPGAPDLEAASSVFKTTNAPRQAVVISSAAVYGARPHNPGFASESSLHSYRGLNPVAAHWIAFEELAQKHLGNQPGTRLVILRPAAVPVQGGTDCFTRLFELGAWYTLPGYDPPIQLLSPEDLAEAVYRVIETNASGIYNIAPTGVVPLATALRLARREPDTRGIFQALLGTLAPLGIAYPKNLHAYLRYTWTVSSQKIQDELGFIPKKSSVDTLLDFRQEPSSQETEGANPIFDDFGLDKDYIAAQGRGLLHFLHRYYWRIETDGLHRIPKGKGVLVGVHRGFMPFDGILTLHLIVQALNRYPRFLIHPTLIKVPFLFNFTKLGGLIACQENADYVLQKDGLLGFYPEGIQGAFTYYRNAHQLGKFGRNEFVKMALRNRAPLIPFLNLGSAEIFPVLGKIPWKAWKRLTLWPCFPIAPPFPLLPTPLPTKWHTRFLEPIHIEDQYPPEAADDPDTVQAISQEVRSRMQEAFLDMKKRRKHIFWGSIFEEAT